MKEQILCLLHTDHDCHYRSSYDHECRLAKVDGFAVFSCLYRRQTTTLGLAANPEVPSENVEQPTEPIISEPVQVAP